MTPLIGQRKVRVNLGEQFDEVGLAENNKWIDMVVEGSDVYLVSLLFCYFVHPQEHSSVQRRWNITSCG